jgi:hypothetical protein
MASHLLFILGTALLGLALRSFYHPILQKLGALAILATSFLIGFFLTGSVLAGCLFAATWFLLPWVEIVTRLRHLRLEENKSLRHKSPPSQEDFPALDELTHEIESQGFSQVDDVGWNWEEQTQFFRLFYHEQHRAGAAICMIEQNDLAFYYLSVSSRGKNGEMWTTWNYPFFYSLQFAPQWKINRVKPNLGFYELYLSHQEFLDAFAIAENELPEFSPDTMAEEMQNDLRRQISHNLSAGLLRRNAAGEIRYSWRGMLFVWMQFLRDSVKL